MKSMSARPFLVIIAMLLANLSLAQDSVEVVIEPYPIAGIAEAHEQNMKALSGIEAFVESAEDLKSIRMDFVAAMEEAMELKGDTVDSSFIDLGLFEIKNIYGDWDRYLLKLKSIESDLEAVNSTLSEEKVILIDYRDRWTKTLELAEKENATDVVEKTNCGIPGPDRRISHNAQRETGCEFRSFGQRNSGTCLCDQDH